MASDQLPECDELQECRHCGWLCKNNETPKKGWYPLEKPVKQSAPPLSVLSQENAWLVGLFDLNGNHLKAWRNGLVHTNGSALCTTDPQRAQRYTEEEAKFAITRHLVPGCVWKAVECFFTVMRTSDQQIKQGTEA